MGITVALPLVLTIYGNFAKQRITGCDLASRATADNIVHQGVLDLIYQKSGIERNKPVVSYLRNGKWTELKFDDLQRAAQHLSNYLIASGIKAGDRIALLSDPSAEFGIVFFAAVRAGAILVPLDPRLSVSELSELVNETESTMLFSSSDRYSLAEELKSNCKSLKSLIVTDNDTLDDTVPSIESVSTHILREGIERGINEVAMIVYTAGVSSKPKGVMLTFENLIFQSDVIQNQFDVGKKDCFLTVTQGDSVTELVSSFLGVLFGGGQVCYLSKCSPAKTLKVVRNRKISNMVVSPSMMVALHKEVNRSLTKLRREQQIRFKMRFGLARLLPHRNRRKLFGAINSVFGSKFRALMTTGSAIDAETAVFFDTVGIDVCHGYGLVETTGPIALNTHQNTKIPSSGKVVDDIEVQLLGAKYLGDQGEIVTRGPHVCAGYFRNESLSKVSIDEDGWFYTGDLGRFDDEGYLHITGRIKDMITLPGGLKYHPRDVEVQLLESKTIKEICIVGLRHEQTFEHQEVVAIVVPSSKTVTSARLIKSLEEAVLDLPYYKRPDRFVIHPDALPKTPSGKVKRTLLAERLKAHKLG